MPPSQMSPSPGRYQTLIGRERSGGTQTITRNRLRLFARAIGQTDPVYTDSAVAAAAGHPDLPVPPTFFFSVDLEVLDPYSWVEEAGIDPRLGLHGEQAFNYLQMAYAGDTLSSSVQVVDAYEKNGSTLQFVVSRSTITKQDGSVVATLHNTMVVKESHA